MTVTTHGARKRNAVVLTSHISIHAQSKDERMHMRKHAPCARRVPYSHNVWKTHCALKISWAFAQDSRRHNSRCLHVDDNT